MPLITPSGTGGVGKHGSGANLALDIAGLTNGTTVLWDNVFWSSETYYNPANGRFTVPAGLGGIYSITACGELLSLGAALTSFQINIVITGAADNFVISGSQAAASGLTWDLAGGMVVQLAAGNSFICRAVMSGPASATLVSGLSGCACILLAQ